MAPDKGELDGDAAVWLFIVHQSVWIRKVYHDSLKVLNK